MHGARTELTLIGGRGFESVSLEQRDSGLGNSPFYFDRPGFSAGVRAGAGGTGDQQVPRLQLRSAICLHRRSTLSSNAVHDSEGGETMKPTDLASYPHTERDLPLPRATKSVASGGPTPHVLLHFRKKLGLVQPRDQPSGQRRRGIFRDHAGREEDVRQWQNVAAQDHPSQRGASEQPR